MPSNRVSDYHASGATRNEDKPGSPTVKQAKGMRKEGRENKMIIGPVQLIIVAIVLGVPITVIVAIVAMVTKKRSKAKKKHCNDN